MRLVLLAVCCITPIGCGISGDSEVPPPEIVGLEDIRTIRPDVGFVGPRDLAMTEGAVWVLDNAPPFLTRVSLDDGSVIRIGAEGQGPGEYRFPWAVQPAQISAGEKGVVVWDLGNGRVSVVGPEGAFLGSMLLNPSHGLRARANIRDLSYVDPFRIRNLKGRIVSGHFEDRVGSTLDVVKGTLQLVHRQLRPEREIARFSNSVDLDQATSPVWASVPLWDACGETVVLWSPATSSVLWLDLDGRVRAQTRIQIPPRIVEPASALSYLRWRVRVESASGLRASESYIRRLWLRFRSIFPEEAPPVTDIRCQAPGGAWLRLFDTSQDPVGRSQTWQMVMGRTSHRRVTFPGDFMPTLFTDHGAVGFMAGADGLQHLSLWSDVTLRTGRKNPKGSKPKE